MELVFSSFVFGSYQKYIPYYIYSIWKTHPNGFVKIFIENKLESKIFKSLEYLNQMGVRNFEIVLWDSAHDDYGIYKIRGGGKKLTRWVLDYEYFNDFNYAYIGDIDILFLSEEMSILDFHKKQMIKLELPFSNKVRSDENGKTVERLTGLHFFEIKKYFEKINPIISRINKDKEYRDKYLQGLERDENFLYKINKEAFDFDSKILIAAERPWHGLHLGITRGNKGLNMQTIQENSSLSISEVKEQLKNYISDPIFKEIQRKVFVIELETILKELSLPYSFNWKYKGFKYRTRDKWRFLKRKIKSFLK